MSRRFRVSTSMKPGSTAPYPDLLVGPGKAGDILRNSLFEVAEAGDGRDGPRLADVVSEIFGCRLLQPAYAAIPPLSSANIERSTKRQRLWRVTFIGYFHDGQWLSSGAAHSGVYVCTTVYRNSSTTFFAARATNEKGMNYPR